VFSHLVYFPITFALFIDSTESVGAWGDRGVCICVLKVGRS